MDQRWRCFIQISAQSTVDGKVVVYIVALGDKQLAKESKKAYYI